MYQRSKLVLFRFGLNYAGRSVVMHVLSGKPIFTVSERVYCWEDIVLAAMCRGEWPKLIEEARFGLRCEEELGRSGVAFPETERTAAIRSFRIARRLAAAPEMKAWLEIRGLSAEVFSDYVLRELLKRKYKDRRAEFLENTTFDLAAVHEKLAIDLLCDGRLRSLVVPFASKVAIGARLREMNVPVKVLETRALDRLDIDAIPDLSETKRREKLIEIEKLSLMWDQFQEHGVGRAEVMAHLSAQPLDWIMFDLLIATFSDESSAREAILCVREDGMTLDAVGKQAGAKVISSRVILRDMQEPMRARLLATAKGDVIGPVAEGKGVLVFAVHDKILPSVENEEITLRVKAHLLSAIVTAEIERRIRFMGVLA